MNITVVLAASFHWFFCGIFCGCLFRRPPSFFKNVLCGHSEASAYLSDPLSHHPGLTHPLVPQRLPRRRVSLSGRLGLCTVSGRCSSAPDADTTFSGAPPRLLTHTAESCLTPALPTTSLCSCFSQTTESPWAPISYSLIICLPWLNTCF